MSSSYVNIARLIGGCLFERTRIGLDSQPPALVIHVTCHDQDCESYRDALSLSIGCLKLTSHVRPMP